MTSAMQEAAARFRAAVLRQERQAALQLIDAYGPVWQQVEADLATLTAQLADAEAPVSPAWLFQQARLERLQVQTTREVQRFATAAEGLITEQQRQTIEAAQREAEDLVRLGLGPLPPGVTVTWARLPTEALTQLIGVLTNGAPLRTLLDELGPDASQAVRDTLIRGVALGWGPRETARQLRAALAGNLTRALTIARTETLRAHNEAARLNYAANRDVVQAWQWLSARGRRTCPACWAMHGTIHDTRSALGSHPRCRCTMVPVLRSWSTLGISSVTDPRRTFPRGSEEFARLDPATQREILGPRKFALFEQGQIMLDDLITRSHSAEWGTQRREATIAEALAHASRRRGVA